MTVLALAAKYFALYSQNDWKVTNKLTVNLGVRWEMQPGPTERFNRLADINLNAPNPYAEGVTLSNPLGGIGTDRFRRKRRPATQHVEHAMGQFFRHASERLIS